MKGMKGRERRFEPSLVLFREAYKTLQLFQHDDLEIGMCLQKAEVPCLQCQVSRKRSQVSV